VNGELKEWKGDEGVEGGGREMVVMYDFREVV
jgi:hypothetical protein